MVEVENIEVMGWRKAIKGMRNAMNSWNRMDSGFCTGDKCFYTSECWNQSFKDKEDFCPLREYDKTGNNKMMKTECGFCGYVLGQNDLDLACRLIKAGPEHRKFLRMIHVQMDITGPLYWWKEMDTYKVATVANSCSTMHRLCYKPFEMSDFSFENLIGNESKEYFDVDCDFKEVFKDVLNHENYSISNKGRVWSKRRDKFLKPSVNSSDYKKVVLDGKNLYVHRLVAEVFCDNKNQYNEVNHIDGNKWNNNYNNLEWVTKSENSQHAFDIGLRTISGYTRYKVSKSMHRFTDDEIDEIKQMYLDGMSKQEIADKLNCYSSTICNIINGKTYREIEMTPYDTAKLLIDNLNELRNKYLETKDKKHWWQLIQLLPSSYNQLRTWDGSMETVLSILHQRDHHKLTTDWEPFRKACFNNIPYCKEFYEAMYGKEEN